MPALVFREYRPGDAAAMFALDQVCFDERFRFSLRAMRRFAEAQNALVWIAEDDGTLAGFVIAHVEPDGVYIVTLDVAPERRRQGIANALMDRLEQAVADTAMPVVWLHVFTENEAAIRFYEHRGYERLGLVPRFYGAGLDAFVYRSGAKD